MNENEHVAPSRRRLPPLRRALATVYRAVRAWVPSTWRLRHSVQLPVVTVGQHDGIRATVGTLTLRRVRGTRRPAGTPALLVDDGGLTATDKAFKVAMSNALAWSAGPRPRRRRGTVVWTLTDACGKPVPSTEGNSAGAAFAVGLSFLYGLSHNARRPVDSRAVISAAVTEGGLLRPVAGLAHKARAVREASHRLVVAHDDGPVAHAARHAGRPHTDTAFSVHEAVGQAVLRRSRIVPLLALALVAAGLGAGLLLRSNDAAQRSERATTIQQLADRSRIAVGTAPDTAARLALQAAGTDPQSMTARTAQLNAAYFDPRLTSVLDAGASPQAVAYDLDGTALAVASRSGVALYSTSGHRRLARMPAIHGTVTALVFAPGHRLLVATDQAVVGLWAPSRGQGVARTPLKVLFEGVGHVQAIAVSPDGSLAAWATTGDGTYTASLRGTAPAVRATPADPRIAAVALPTDGQLVIGRIPDQQKPALVLYDLAHRQAQPRVLLRRGHLELTNQAATALVVADSGHRLISAHLDESLRIWDTTTYKELKEISVPGSAVALALSRDGHTATVAVQSFPAVGTIDRQAPGAAVVMVDLATSRQLGTQYAADYACLTAVLATAPGGDEAAVVTVAGRVTFWQRSVQPPPRGAVYRIVSDPSHPASVLVLHRPGTVLRYQAAALSRSPEGVVDASTYGMGLDMALSPNGRVLAVSHASGATSLWKYPQGTPLGKALDTGAERGAHRLVFAPDSLTLAAGDESGHAILFDLRSHRRKTAIKDSDTAAINALVFSADSRSLVIARGDGTTYVIDSATGRPVREVTMNPVATTVTRHGDGYLIGFTDGHLGRYDQSLRLTGALGGAPPQDYVAEATESPDHSLIATTGPQQDGVLTDTSTGATVLRLPANEYPDSNSDQLSTSFISNGFSADGRYAVFGSARGQLTSVALEGAQLRDRLCALLSPAAKECR